MRWNCPHCGIGLTLSDEKLTSTWSFARCARCRGHSLVRTGDLNMIRIDQIPKGHAVFSTEEQAEYTERPMIVPANRKPASLSLSESRTEHPAAATAPADQSFSLPSRAFGAPSADAGVSGVSPSEAAPPLPPPHSEPKEYRAVDPEPTLPLGTGATAAGPALPVLDRTSTQSPILVEAPGKTWTPPSASEITAATSAIESLAAVIAANSRVAVKAADQSTAFPVSTTPDQSIASEPSAVCIVTPPPFDPRRLLNPPPADLANDSTEPSSLSRFIPLAIGVCALAALASGIFMFRYGERIYLRAQEGTQETQEPESAPAAPHELKDRIEEKAMAPIRATPEPPRPLRLQIQATQVLLRSGPGTQYRVIGTAKTGAQYLISASKDRWFHIELENGRTAWVRNDLVRVTESP